MEPLKYAGSLVDIITIMVVINNRDMARQGISPANLATMPAPTKQVILKAPLATNRGTHSKDTRCKWLFVCFSICKALYLVHPCTGA